MLSLLSEATDQFPGYPMIVRDKLLRQRGRRFIDESHSFSRKLKICLIRLLANCSVLKSFHQTEKETSPQ